MWGEQIPPDRLSRGEKKFRKIAFFCLTLRAVDRIASQFE